MTARNCARYVGLSEGCELGLGAELIDGESDGAELGAVDVDGFSDG